MTGVTQFHFTIGPVQDFVAQARRTRDFWAGSFILAWLSAVAMKAVAKQGGSIQFPRPDSDFMAALETPETANLPKQGTVPNRFMANVGPDFEPERIPEAVQAAWWALAEQVWQGDGLGEITGTEARAIWERQVGGLWEITWAMTEANDASVLDRRKNWRSHRPPEEPGPKCHVMAGWQELSGAERPGAGPTGFWDRLRNEVLSEGIRTDVREGEQLCAPAYIKRRLTRHFHTIDAEMPGGWRLRGWRLPSGVPSVATRPSARTTTRS
ncbi:MAG: type III-B CRISPR-associated protein Cas10/Cmr2, partial [Thiohalorhabdaceae bacterium]